MAAPAPAPAPGGDAIKDLLFFIGLIFGLMFLWYFMGGRENRDPNEKPFLEDPTGTTIGKQNGSSYQNKISLSAPYDGRKSNAREEYVVIESFSNNDSKVNVTGWSLQNKKGEVATIGQSAEIPYPDQQNTLGNVYLSPGEKIFVNTGPSPVGPSFRVNECVGYFNERVPFYPKLTENCPSPTSSEIYPAYIENSCIDFMKKNIKKCKTTSAVSDLSVQCAEYLTSKTSYQGCVNDHKNNSNFFQKEWRVFLNKGSEMWNDDSDTILLKDSKGKTVDSINI